LSAPTRALLLIALTALPLRASAESGSPLFFKSSAPPRIELLTIGAGQPLFARFGHAALRVVSSREDVVFNFGYADFTNPNIVVDVLQRRAIFWGAKDRFRATMWDYRREDRSIYSQRLILTPAQARRLATLIYRSVNSVVGQIGPRKGVGYVYHHFEENCATRLRDLIDQALDGALAREMKGNKTGMSFRDVVRQAVSKDPLVVFGVDLGLGRKMDDEMDQWDAAFLPRLLRRYIAEVRLAGKPLAEKPVYLWRRKGPAHDQGDVLFGARAVWLATIALSWLSMLAGLAALRGFRIAGLGPFLLALVFFVIPLPLWFLAAAARITELNTNEILLLCWPTDILLVGMGMRFFRGRFFVGGFTRRYLELRLMVLGLAVILHAVGALQQRPFAWVAVFAIPLVLLYLSVRHLPHSHRHTGRRCRP
jgi:hypothetical protein